MVDCAINGLRRTGSPVTDCIRSPLLAGSVAHRHTDPYCPIRLVLPYPAYTAGPVPVELATQQSGCFFYAYRKKPKDSSICTSETEIQPCADAHILQ